MRPGVRHWGWSRQGWRAEGQVGNSSRARCAAVSAPGMCVQAAAQVVQPGLRCRCHLAGSTARLPSLRTHLHRATARKEVHLPHAAALSQLRERMRRDVSRREVADAAQQNARAVERHIADAADRDAVHIGQVHRQRSAVGVAVVPPHKLARRKHARRFLSGHAQAAITLRAIREHDLGPRRGARHGRVRQAAVWGRPLVVQAGHCAPSFAARPAAGPRCRLVRSRPRSPRCTGRAARRRSRRGRRARSPGSARVGRRMWP